MCLAINCTGRPTGRYGVCFYAVWGGWILAAFVDDFGCVSYGFHWVGNSLEQIAWTPGSSQMLTMLTPGIEGAMRGYYTYWYRFNNSYTGNHYKLWVCKPGDTVNCDLWDAGTNRNRIKMVSDGHWFIFSNPKPGDYMPTTNISTRGSVNYGVYTAEDTTDTYFVVTVSPASNDTYGYIGILVSPLAPATRWVLTWRE